MSIYRLGAQAGRSVEFGVVLKLVLGRCAGRSVDEPPPTSTWAAWSSSMLRLAKLSMACARGDFAIISSVKPVTVACL
jgi:hypothetical protein